MDEILGRENYSVKSKVENIIAHPDFYTVNDIENVYKSVRLDKRLNLNTQNKLLAGLRRVYKNKVRR